LLLSQGFKIKAQYRVPDRCAVEYPTKSVIVLAPGVRGLGELISVGHPRAAGPTRH
jgi:hypothetical protein